MTPHHLVLRAFRQPDAFADLSLGDWDLLVRQARQANLLASLYAMLNERGMLKYVPPQAREHLEWSHVIAERHCEAVEWEVSRIQEALRNVGISIILLKGAAYAVAKFPIASGRLFSDIDIMVPKASLAAVEAALMLHGWAATHHDAYDQRYYRTWMHELPPMQHVKRLTVIDVHHAILPETAPIHPDPQKLRAAAVKVDGYDSLMILAPADMVLHSAVHLLHDGELDNGLRDLVDIDFLLRRFSSLPSFWVTLAGRARELELMRPLFYALRYAAYMLHTSVPSSMLEVARTGRPNWLTLKLMDELFVRALMPDHPSCTDWLTVIARPALYIRANWLRMPPLLLARHLFHKAFISPKEE